MKGIIFNLLEGFVTERWDEETYEELLGKCLLKTKDPGVIVGPGTYPDEDFMAIMTETADNLGVTPAEALRDFGRYAVPRLAERYPQFFSPYRHPKNFLKTVDFIHHIEIAKLYKGAETPKFSTTDPAPDRLVMRYSSARRLCHFVGGLIEGLSDYYGTPIEQTQTECVHEGDGQCVFDIVFKG